MNPSRPVGPLDYAFRALALLGVLEIGALAVNVATQPDGPGIAGQGLFLRTSMGLLVSPTMLMAGALFREGVRALVASEPDTELVGQAASGDEAVALAEHLQPDVILMDIQMPGLNGIEATRRIAYASPHIGVLVLTMFEDDGSVFAAVRAGARGYLLKGATHAEMLQAIRTAAAGGAIFSPAIAVRLSEFFARLPPRAVPTFPDLNEREHEILNLLARGHNNAEIAVALSLSPKTVRNYVSNILSKLHVADRAEAIVRAREAGLGQGAG